MDRSRGVAWATVAVVAVVAVASGPLVPGVDFTHPRDRPVVGAGEPDEIDLAVVSAPTDGVRFERGRYGSGTYHLRVPDATVEVGTVRGRPRVVYKLRVPELGYVRASPHFLDSSHAGLRVTLSIETDTMAPDRITEGSYEGVLFIVVREEDRAETVYRANVTVAVSG